MDNIQYFKHPTSFHLESGKEIADLKIAYQTFGSLNDEGSNIIWVFHALSANANVLEWWDGLFGTGYLFDPKDYFIICANVIGSPYGSTKPTDLYFPQFSVRDVANAELLLAKHLHIKHIHVAIGGSFGGDQALEFAYMFTGQIENLILIASCAKESAWAIAVHETQRLAMKSDPSFGQEGKGADGMKAARAIGMLTYRTSDAFIDTQTDHEEKIDQFKASSYIRYQGEKFVKRFDALCYYYLTKCLDSHNLGRNRGGVNNALNQIKTKTLVIGIDSDQLIPLSLQKEMAEGLPLAIFEQIKSEFGHDGFLVETKKIGLIIQEFLSKRSKKVKVLKFGGKSLGNGGALEKSLKRIKEINKTGQTAIVVSARGNSTDQLLEMYELAVSGTFDNQKFDQFFLDQNTTDFSPDLEIEKIELKEKLKAIITLGLDLPGMADQIVCFGELISAKTIALVLEKEGEKVKQIDSREVIKTYRKNGRTLVDMAKSELLTRRLFDEIPEDCTVIFTGYIASNEKGQTTTLGRNGSNYSATLLAKFIQADEVQNWTDVSGIYSANPKLVSNATRIKHLSFREANELANFGINLLHSKTILPLMDANIPLRIFNSFVEHQEGTLIDSEGSGKGIKAVSVIDDVSLISIEGTGLVGKVGIDSRIFSKLSEADISIRLISQASSERGIGFVVNKEDANQTEQILNEEFAKEIDLGEISAVRINSNTAIIAITGRHNYALEKAIMGLRKSKIWVHLFSNSINGENISLVIDNKYVTKAINVVHDYVLELKD